MKASRGEKVFYAVNDFLLLIVGLSCLFPLIHIMSMSLSSANAVMAGRVSVFPIDINLESFRVLFNGTPIVRAFYNNVVITVVGVLISLAATVCGAFPLSRKYFYGRKFFTMMCVFTMLFGGGLIPTYLVVRNLGLVNTYWALWLPGLVGTWNMLVMRAFFQNIPAELEEAARIDGCSEVQLIFRVFIPLSLPAMATMSLHYGVNGWNAFMSVLIYINDSAKYNLGVLINNMISNSTVLGDQYVKPEEILLVTPEGVQAAGIMVMIIPILMVYPFLQKYFVKGTMLGSIKG